MPGQAPDRAQAPPAPFDGHARNGCRARRWLDAPVVKQDAQYGRIGLRAMYFDKADDRENKFRNS